MRRFVAVLAALVLAVSAVCTSLAAAPVKTDRFVGNFVMIDDQGVPLGTVVANFGPPTDRHMVPGSLDVYWARDTTFPFPDSLNYRPAQESHAQLFSGFFGPDVGGIVAGTEGYLCDYSAPWNAVCREFSVIFIQWPDGSRGVAWAFRAPGDTSPFDYVYWYGVGTGQFTLVYGYPT